MILKRGRLAATELISWQGRQVVLKTLRMMPRIPLVSREIDRYLALREVRQLRRSEGIDGIPRVLGRPSENSYVREFVEGISLPRAPTQSPGFYLQLLEITRALHRRGITHNDLHKEANVIVRPDGRPGVLDFQLSLSLPPGSALHRLLVRFDLYHVVKNKRHRLGGELAGEERRLFEDTKRLRRLHRGIFKRPMNLLTRRLFPRALGKLPTDTDP